MGLALPKLRWLVLGAVAAGAWAVHQDMKGPRPPESVPPARKESANRDAPRPPKAVAAKPAEPNRTVARETPARPIPPRTVPGKTEGRQAKASTKPPQQTALALPDSVARPPSRPQQIVTSSIARPEKPVFVQTRTKVRLHAQARADAAVIATLEPRTVMRELARSGDWRLVMGDGRKGWVKADRLAQPTFLPRRPKLPVAEVRSAKALGNGQTAKKP